MKVIHIDLPADFESIEVIGFGDAHIGDAHCDLNAIQACVNYILAAPNRYAIINGDWQNMALKNSKSDVYSDVLSPKDQVNKSVDLLSQISDRILAILPGNHEERVAKETGIDITETISRRLGIYDKYANTSVLLFVSFGKSHSKSSKKNVYSIYCNHGFGGGATNGGKLNNVMKLDGIVDADLYMMGHLHAPSSTKVDYYRLDYQNKKAKKVTRSYLLHNAWLRYGGYGERFGYRPSTITIAKAVLNGFGYKNIALTI